MLFALLHVFALAQTPAKEAAITEKVNALLQRMTLEEKVGQMTQVTLGVIAQNGGGNARRRIVAGLLGKLSTVAGVCDGDHGGGRRAVCAGDEPAAIEPSAHGRGSLCGGRGGRGGFI